MTRRVALSGGLLVTLARPTTWPLALAAFLIRGGLVLFVLPIVVVPTPVGIGDVVGPALTAIALGGMPPEAVIGAGVAIVGLLVWLVGGGWLAAALEVEAARIVASDEDVAAIAAPDWDAEAMAVDESRTAWRILAARLIADIPLLLVLAWGSVRLIVVTYGELTSPADVSMPIILRVLRATPEVVAAIVLAWMAGEMVGAVAARRIVLAGDGVRHALLVAVRTCLWYPVAALTRFWLPTVVLAVVVLPSALAAGSAWSAAAAALDAVDDPLRTVITVVALVFLWVVGLLLASVVCAWRAAVWTIAEVQRQGTFGGSSDRRPGDWRTEGSSATL